jgi:hypothetical protein
MAYSFNRGDAPEGVQKEFPLLKLPQTCAAIAFYLDHQGEIDEYLEQAEHEIEACPVPLAEENPALWERLQRARGMLGKPRTE